MGKEPEKTDICICITESLWCIPETTQHCKPTKLQYKIKIKLKKESYVKLKVT